MGPNYDSYAAKMRAQTMDGIDLDVVARFADMLCPRNSRILDIGCGIGNTVNALRRCGHDAYGVDPTPQVLDVAKALFDGSWFRQLSADQLSLGTLNEHSLPEQYDAILMTGNVPAFISRGELRSVFDFADRVIRSNGVLIVGTTSNAHGGPTDQTDILKGTSLKLVHRFADWHLGPYGSDSLWSVSVYARTAQRSGFGMPDGIFVLPS